MRGVRSVKRSCFMVSKASETSISTAPAYQLLSNKGFHFSIKNTSACL